MQRSSETIGLIAGNIEVAAADRALPAYRAVPDLPGPQFQKSCAGWA